MASLLDHKEPLDSEYRQPVGHNPLYYPSQPIQLGGLDGSHRRRDRSRTCKRFFKFLLMTAVVMAVGRSLLRHKAIPFVRHWKGRFVKTLEDYPIPDNVALSHCVAPGDWEDATDETSDLHPFVSFDYKSKYHFDVPLAPDTLWFMTKGALSFGGAKIITSPDQPKDKITYKVVVHYNLEDARDRADVCIIKNKDAENQEGVGIFTPNYRKRGPRHERHLLFETTITFPETEDGSPLIIKNFIADTFITSVSTSSLIDKIVFEKIDIESKFSPITVTSLTAIEGKLYASNAPIRGHFNTTGSLELITSNADIKAHILATSEKDGLEPSVLLRTANAPIEGVFYLTSPEDAPGTFHVDVKTSNAPLDIKFEEAPADSVLDFNGKSSNSPAKVFLHPTFEGSFSAETDLFFKANVLVDENEEDPSGKERQKKVTFEGKNTPQSKQGFVVWGDGEKSKLKGRVEVKTSLSPVELHI